MAEIYTQQKQAQYTNMSEQNYVDRPDYIGQGLANVSKELARVADDVKKDEDKKAADDMRLAVQEVEDTINNWVDFDATSAEEMEKKANSILNDKFSGLDPIVRNRFVANNPRWYDLSLLKTKEAIVKKQDEHIYATRTSEIPAVANAVSAYVDGSGVRHMYSNEEFVRRLQDVINEATNDPSLSKYPAKLRAYLDTLVKEAYTGRSSEFLYRNDFANATSVLDTKEAQRVLTPSEIIDRKSTIRARQEAYLEAERKRSASNGGSGYDGNIYEDMYNALSIINGTGDAANQATSNALVKFMDDSTNGDLNAAIFNLRNQIQDPSLLPAEKQALQSWLNAYEVVASMPKSARQAQINKFASTFKEHNDGLARITTRMSAQLDARVNALADLGAVDSDNKIKREKLTTKETNRIKELLDEVRPYYYFLGGEDQRVVDKMRMAIMAGNLEFERAVDADKRQMVSGGYFGMVGKDKAVPFVDSAQMNPSILSSSSEKIPSMFDQSNAFWHGGVLDSLERSLKKEKTAYWGWENNNWFDKKIPKTDTDYDYLLPQVRKERESLVKTVDFYSKTYGGGGDKTPALGTYEALPFEILAVAKRISEQDLSSDEEKKNGYTADQKLTGIPKGSIGRINGTRMVENLQRRFNKIGSEFADKALYETTNYSIVPEMSETAAIFDAAFAELGLPPLSNEAKKKMVTYLWTIQGRDKGKGTSRRGESEIDGDESSLEFSARIARKAQLYKPSSDEE